MNTAEQIKDFKNIIEGLTLSELEQLMDCALLLKPSQCQEANSGQPRPN